jgi:RNA polymerase sigma factor (sigma-70 family)
VNDQTDSQLLHAYAEHRSEPAFTELVRRHVDFVYSAALRMVCDSHLAEDVTQGVFVALAKNATQLMDRPVLSGWLHRSAQNIAAQTVRTDVRRRTREQEAATMNKLLSAEPDTIWEHVASQLDEALGELNEGDRDALLLRYFERKSARAMAQTLGTSEDAAQKRVSRAVERLREFFIKRGITVGASGLVVVITANAVQAAPVGLAATIATAAALTGTTIATAATATKAIAMTTLQKTLVTAIITACVAAPMFVQHRSLVRLREENQILQQQADQLAQSLAENERLSNLVAQAKSSQALSDERLRELLRLRAKVGFLSDQTNELARLRQENRQLHSSVVAGPNLKNIPPPGAVIPKASWAFVGYGTPEAALQSVMWAMNNGDMRTYLASLSPEAQESSLQNFEGKSENEIAERLRGYASTTDALRLDRKNVTADGLVNFVLSYKEEDDGNATSKQDICMQFKNIGGEWKVADPQVSFSTKRKSN